MKIKKHFKILNCYQTEMSERLFPGSLIEELLENDRSELKENISSGFI